MTIKDYLLLFLFTSVALMGVALYNGYPLLDSDSGGYIEQAIYPHLPADDTPFYALFLRVTSLWTSLWFTIAVQCALLAVLLLKYIGRFGRQEVVPALFSVAAILSFTGVCWVSAYLLPMVFTGILLLAILLYLSHNNSRRWSQGMLAAIILFAIAQHTSHCLIVFLFAVVMLARGLLARHRALVLRSAQLMGMAMFFWVIMCTINLKKGHGFVYSRSSHVFMMARLSENGILGDYFSRSKTSVKFSLHNYRNELPEYATEFLWAHNSPLYQTGGWDSSQAQYQAIISDIFTTPRYFWMFAGKSVVATGRQLVQVQPPDVIPSMQKGTVPYDKVATYFADELRTYVTTMQNNNVLQSGECSYVYYLFFIISSMWVLLMYGKVITQQVAFIYSCIFLFLVVNAWVTGALVTVSYRHQFRIFWILPATNLLVLMKYYFGRRAGAIDPGHE